MIKVALTGGIGSGKTTIAKFFIELGIPVYFSDIEAKRLMHTSKSIKKKLIAEFGEKVFLNNKLNRHYLADIVFNNKKKLAILNAIVHPSVAISFGIWAKNQKATYVIQENAILFENNKQDKFDYIITVTAPLSVRVERVVKRDNTTKNKVIERINNQLSDKEKIEKSDFVIENIDLSKSKAQVKKIHTQLVKLNTC